MKKFEFYFKDNLKDLKTRTAKLGLESKLENTKNFLKQKTKNFSLRRLDERKTKKIDEWNYKFEKKIREGFTGLKSLMSKSKDAPNVIKNQTKDLKNDVKSFFKDNYYEAKNHVKNYFKDNQKFFEYKLNIYRNSYRKKKNNILIIGGLAIFTYAAGANLPYAIVKYKLAQESQERSKAEIEELPPSPQPEIHKNSPETTSSSTLNIIPLSNTEPSSSEPSIPIPQNLQKVE
jgi:hypothetical protein